MPHRYPIEFASEQPSARGGGDDSIRGQTSQKAEPYGGRLGKLPSYTFLFPWSEASLLTRSSRDLEAFYSFDYVFGIEVYSNQCWRALQYRHHLEVTKPFLE